MQARTMAADMRTSLGGLVLVGLLLLVSGCGNGRLTPMETCATMLTHADTCGSYVVGQFGGTDLETDIAGCTRSVMLFNERCQGIMSDIAQCLARGCDAESRAACQPLTDQLRAECMP